MLSLQWLHILDLFTFTLASSSFNSSSRNFPSIQLMIFVSQLHIFTSYQIKFISQLVDIFSVGISFLVPRSRSSFSAFGRLLFLFSNSLSIVHFRIWVPGVYPREAWISWWIFGGMDIVYNFRLPLCHKKAYWLT